MYDVLVIGGGLAGAVAAKKAAEAARGRRRVGLVRAGGGGTVHASGAFDVAAPPGSPGARAEDGGVPLSLARCVAALLRDRPDHPYAVVAAGSPERLLALIEEATKDLFAALEAEGLPYRGSLKRNLWLATAPSGRVKDAAFAQEGIAAGDLAAMPKARLLVVGLGRSGPGLGIGFGEGGAALAQAKLAALALRRELDRRGFGGLREIVGARCDELPFAGGARGRGEGGAGGPIAAEAIGVGPVAPDPVSVARALDDEAVCAAWVRGALVRAIEQAGAARATHVLLPPVLGLANHAGVLRTLRRELGGATPTEAVAAGVPSVPGLRLELALRAMLAAKPNVEVVPGRAVSAEVAGGHVRRIAVRHGPGTEPGTGTGSGRGSGATTWLEAKAFVLAGGKFLGGGLRDGNRLEEPLFDLPLFGAGGRRLDTISFRPEDWLKRRFGDEHPIFSVGVRCGRDLRPWGDARSPIYENLFAAGSILAGHGAAPERAGLGVALVTGFVAGTNAAEAA